MVIDAGSRSHRPGRLRIVAALLIALIVGLPPAPDHAVASPADSPAIAPVTSSDGHLPLQAQASPNQPPHAPRAPGRVAPNQVGIRAKSAFEQTHNPFGDDWELKTASNPSIPVGLTPVCYHLPGKPDAAENRFVALSNTLVFTECVDLADVSIPDAQGVVGNPLLKEQIAQLKALNPQLRYIGFLQGPRADTRLAGGAGKPVGLSFIDANREDWFVHVAGQGISRASRVKYANGISDLYDVTNADFRQFMIDAIVASLNHHSLDGFVMADCLDLPFNAPATPVPPAILANWEAGCDAWLQGLKSALDPLNKIVLTFGYDHIGTRGQGGANEAAAFALFQKRMTITHGLFWEDPFRGVTAPDFSAESSFERYKRLRDVAVPQGRYIVHSNNTREGDQSTFATTNPGQQRALARYYLAQFLAAMAGPLTVMHHYFPTSVGEQFVSNAYFKEWDLRVGDPLGPDTKPATAVYQREFQNARVVANLSSTPFTVSLADGEFTNEDGVPVGQNAVVPPKSGAIFMRVVRQAICTPRPAVRVSTAALGGGQIRVTVAASGTGTPGNNTLRSIRFNAVDNGTIDAGNLTGSPGNVTVNLPFDATQTTFVIRRAAGGRATTVRFVVTDGCGDWPSFSGMGPAVP